MTPRTFPSPVRVAHDLSLRERWDLLPLPLGEGWGEGKVPELKKRRHEAIEGHGEQKNSRRSSRSVLRTDSNPQEHQSCS
jgi:hypothetical protein